MVMSRRRCFLDTTALLVGGLSIGVVRALAPSRMVSWTQAVASQCPLRQRDAAAVTVHDGRKHVLALRVSEQDLNSASSRNFSALIKPKKRRVAGTASVTVKDSARRKVLADQRPRRRKRLKKTPVADTDAAVVRRPTVRAPANLKQVQHSDYMTLLEAAARRHFEIIKATAKQNKCKRSLKDMSPFALAGPAVDERSHEELRSPAQGTEAGLESNCTEVLSGTYLSSTTTGVAKNSQPPTKRRSKYFWSDPENTRKEVANFWEQLGVVSDKVR